MGASQNVEHNTHHGHATNRLTGWGELGRQALATSAQVGNVLQPSFPPRHRSGGCPPPPPCLGVWNGGWGNFNTGNNACPLSCSRCHRTLVQSPIITPTVRQFGESRHARTGG